MWSSGPSDSIGRDRKEFGIATGPPSLSHLFPRFVRKAVPHRALSPSSAGVVRHASDPYAVFESARAGNAMVPLVFLQHAHPSAEQLGPWGSLFPALPLARRGWEVVGRRAFGFWQRRLRLLLLTERCHRSI